MNPLLYPTGSDGAVLEQFFFIGSCKLDTVIFGNQCSYVAEPRSILLSSWAGFLKKKTLLGLIKTIPKACYN